MAWVFKKRVYYTYYTNYTYLLTWMILQIFKYGLGLKKKTKQPHFLAIFASIHPSIQLPQATKWARFVTDMDLKDADAGSFMAQAIREGYIFL